MRVFRLLGPCGLLLVLFPSSVQSAAPVDYNRDVRPILSNHCYTCHGPDQAKRKAGLRLDLRESAFRRLRSGAAAVVPGNRARSALFERITTGEDMERMPPPRTGKKLSPAEIEILGRWIDQGAPWAIHWAYVPPSRPRLPEVRDRTWPRNAIDYFVLARLEREGLRPAPEADRTTLIRRLSLDLTGLPPTVEEVDAFLADRSPNAYEKVVDRLLASPHYGERMAQHWLDLARYADTNGYRLDNHRDMWRWRDWVIAAFNANKPFDQFTIEQLAGDLLPGATLEQKIATGFHRNTMVNFGNGSDPKEYLAKAVSDRAITTAAVWLGTTLGCAQCHDHKYDPFTQKDFYRLYAFFNNVPEKGLDGARANPVPSIAAPTPDQERRLAALRQELTRVEGRLRQQPPGRPGALDREFARLKQAEHDLLRAIPTVMVMEEMAQPRVTRVQLRGDYLSEGEVVTPGVPASLPPLSPGAPVNRLGLARWLVHPGHPLTSRVLVNRHWQLFFGAGLVRTSEDFGAQGEIPSHPELLDWLAIEFMDPSPQPSPQRGEGARGEPSPQRGEGATGSPSPRWGEGRVRGWDVKALQKLIVTSATYRQSSQASGALRERDPENRLLARGPRFRLDAEQIRDNALAIAGLLDRRIGGPSVRPYQPAGLWEQVALGGDYSSQTYVQSHGRDLYRRGIYVYWKRSLPYPPLATFDAPSRESCTVSRPRTNTPLQALVLLNDPTSIEAARGLAQRVLREGGPDPVGRLRYAFRLCTGRLPEGREMQVLGRVLDGQLRIYRQDPRAALDLLSTGEAPLPAGLDARDLAAWTAVGNLLLNLDETMTRE